MLTVEGWTTIRYLHAQGMGVRAIAKELSVSRKTVRRALRGDGPPRYERAKRPNPKLDPFGAQIRELSFTKHLIGSRIFREVRAVGYTGGATALYAYLRSLKGMVLSSKATMRFETAPGQQGQFDWSPYTIDLGGTLTRVIVYSLILGYSRRKHYTASRDERQGSIFEAIEESLWHFGGAPKEILVDNAGALVQDANPAHFRWNPQFLELCGHYRMAPRACQVRRAQTKGKIERPFSYLEQQFIKGTTFRGWSHFLEELARFEREDLDVRVHQTTQQRPLDRFAVEQPQLTPLPDGRFVGTAALVRKVSWDCLISYRGCRYSVPAPYAGKTVWLLVSHGTHLLVLNGQRDTIAEHALTVGRTAPVIIPEHYNLLRRGTPRTYVVLARTFLARFPHHAAFLEGLTAQHKLNPAAPLRAVMELTTLYDDASLHRVFALAREYNTYSPAFLRGLLESEAIPQSIAPEPPLSGMHGLPAPSVHCDLGVYQRLLEGERC